MISRRSFLYQATLTAGAIALPNLSQATPDNNQVLRIGLIGTGSRGQGLASLMRSISGVELVACCDIIPDHLTAGMQYAVPGAKSYTDYRKLLENRLVNAVIIATPLFLHYPMAIEALGAGKHVYLEKSMTYDIPQAIDLADRVKKSKLIFQVGYQYRNYALYHRVKEVIRQNWLGKITHFECQYNRNSNWRVPVDDPKMERALNWRMYREYCGGPLSELCAHQIDAVHFLLESHPLKVTAMGGIDYWKDGRETYDNIRAIYEYPGGIKSSVTSVLSNAYNGFGIRILGDKATVEIQREKAWIYAESTDNLKGIVDGVSGATVANLTQGKPIELEYQAADEERTDPTITALTAFVHSVATGEKPVSNAETAKISSIAVHMGNAAADKKEFQYWKPEYGDVR